MGPLSTRPPEDEKKPTEFYQLLHELKRTDHPTEVQREELWRLARLSPRAASESLSHFDILPDRPEVYDWMAEQTGEKNLPIWVLLKDPRRRSELVAAARDGEEAALIGLAKLDWGTAEPIARSLTSSSSFSSVTSLGLLFAKYPDDQRIRDQLMSLVNSPTSNGFRREFAAQALLGEDSEAADALFESLWPRPEWGTDLKGEPLVEFVARNSKRWIPRLVSELGDPSTVRHYNAAHLLVDLGTAESLRPLLPWARHPEADWALVYFEALVKVDLPEAVPMLLEIVERSPEKYLVEAAVEALMRYDAPELPKLLRQRISSPGKDGVTKGAVAHGLRLNLFSQAEKSAALRELAQALSKATGEHQRWELLRPISTEDQVTSQRLLGLALIDAPDAELVSEMLALGDRWHVSQDPGLAGLEYLILELRGPFKQSYALGRLGQGDASPALLRLLFETAIYKAAELQALRPELEKIAGSGGTKGTVALCLLGEQQRLNEALRKGSPQTIETLLTVARTMGLTVDLKILEERAQDQALRDVALAYLEPRPDGASHELSIRLGSAYPITGEAYVGENSSYLKEVQAEVIAAYQKSGKDGEVYCLTGFSGGYTAFPFQYEVWTGAEQAEFRISMGPSGYEVRPLVAEELESFERFIADRGVDEWPQSEWTGRTHIPVYEYLHLKPRGGHRVTANIQNLGSPDKFEAGKRYGELNRLFQDLSDKPTWSVYTAVANIPGAKIVYDSHWKWSWLPEANSVETADSLYGPSDDSVLARLEVDDKILGWRRVEVDGLGEFVEPPEFDKALEKRIDKTRPVQPAGKQQSWAAREDENGTAVGLLNRTKSHFVQKAYYPNLRFSTSSMWVAGPHLYVISRGDILRFPLGDFSRSGEASDKK